MKLILFRHAKSDWASGATSDHERPLNARGRESAPLMGRFLADTGQVPDRVLASGALRARETLELAAAAGGWECEIETTDALYATSPPAVLDLVRAQDDAHAALLLVGHEPTWSDLAGLLVGSAHLRFPTAAMARIDFEGSRWTDVAPGAGRLAWLVTPKLWARAIAGEG